MFQHFLKYNFSHVFYLLYRPVVKIQNFSYSIASFYFFYLLLVGVCMFVNFVCGHVLYRHVSV
jgi:hypothetical protein